jgi:hypothetical protein
MFSIKTKRWKNLHQSQSPPVYAARLAMYVFLISHVGARLTVSQDDKETGSPTKRVKPEPKPLETPHDKSKVGSVYRL